MQSGSSFEYTDATENFSWNDLGDESDGLYSKWIKFTLNELYDGNNPIEGRIFGNCNYDDFDEDGNSVEVGQEIRKRGYGRLSITSDKRKVHNIGKDWQYYFDYNLIELFFEIGIYFYLKSEITCFISILLIESFELFLDFD